MRAPPRKRPSCLQVLHVASRQGACHTARAVQGFGLCRLIEKQSDDSRERHAKPPSRTIIVIEDLKTNHANINMKFFAMFSDSKLLLVVRFMKSYCQ